MIVSGCALDIYCDNIQEIDGHKYHLGKLFHRFDLDEDSRATYFYDGPKCYSKVKQIAKKDGWKFNNKDGTNCRCPKCNKK